MIGRNDPCWCNSGKKWKKCHFPAPPERSHESFAVQSKTYAKKWGILLKTPEQIEKIRRANLLAAALLDEVCEKAIEGATTGQLNDISHKLILKAGAVPASLNYGFPPFPKSICTSLNDVICHGIPDETVLKEGDILNVDLAVILDGYFGDCSKMIAIGKVSKEKKRVFDTSLACLKGAAKILRPGLLICEIGNKISNIAEQQGCGVVKHFVGHGVGIKYHEPPQVPHCRNAIRIPLVAGMTFTIEPMINGGTADLYIDEHDKWTAKTQDGQPSAQWEWTFLITEEGSEILTPWRETSCESF